MSSAYLHSTMTFSCENIPTMLVKWENIPYDLATHIIQYTGKMKNRCGKLMGQIPTDDVRYTLLRTIPVKQYYPLLHCRYCEINVKFHNEKYRIMRQHFDNNAVTHYFYMLHFYERILYPE